MLHMNKTLRYQSIYHSLKTVMVTRGLPCSHFIAGMLVGQQIGIGISDTEYRNLSRLVEELRNAD